MSKVFTITEGLENLGALSTGGQGSVYKGKRIGTIITAVKIMPTPIHTENEDDKNFIKFNSEVEKLKKVNEVPNPNVVKIIGSGLTESGSFPFIEMEYIEGPDLEKLLMPPHPPVFTIHETIKVAEQLANALAHCHKVGIKHGDIKSNNVKFNNDTGNYVLLDFGLAITSTEQRRTSLRHAGAVEFMAPEQHDGEMFFQTDVYSYGIILYELLAGTVPFPLINKNETSRNNVMLSHMETPVPDLLALRRNHLPESWDEERKAREMKVPAWLLELIGKCLEKKPERRYANGSALQEAIVHRAAENFVAKPQAVLADPVKQIVNPTQADEPAGDEIRLSKPVFAILILLIVILGILSVYGMYFKSDDPNRFANRIDSTQVNHRDTLQSIVQRTDTVPQVKPVAVDTAAQKAEIDSLKKEYEAQMAASAKRAQDEAKAKEDKENTIVSNGKKYVLPKGTVYFYEAANATSAKNGVLGLWSNAKFNVIEEQNGFIYVTHSNKDGEVTKGWLNKADLKEVKEQ